jgi:hypothetical protein
MDNLIDSQLTESLLKDIPDHELDLDSTEHKKKIPEIPVNSSCDIFWTCRIRFRFGRCVGAAN